MYIVDARSTNGTKLNGGNVSSERYGSQYFDHNFCAVFSHNIFTPFVIYLKHLFSRTELKDGDIIKAGKTEIAFHVTN